MSDVDLPTILRDIAAERRNLVGDYWSRDYCNQAAEIEALRAEVQRLQALTQWQPIGTAPKDGTRVLLLNDLREFGSDRVIVEAMWRTASQSAWWSCPVRGGYIGENPTHWMPLPEPQVGEK